MKPKLVIVGYVNVDVNRYPDGSEQVLSGGAAYFVALAASLVTSDVGLVTCLGSEFQDALLLSRLNPFAMRRSTTRESSKSIQTYHDFNDLSQRSVELLAGAAEELTLQDIPENWLAEASIVHIATMPPVKQLPFLTHAAAARKTNPALKISMDIELAFLKNPEGRAATMHNLAFADIVFMNRREQEALNPDLSKIPLVLLKRDSEGAEAFKFGTSLCSVKAPQVKAEDVTGAGDMFAGTFLGLLTQKVPLDQALCSACDKASQSVTKQGIQHLFG